MRIRQTKRASQDERLLRLLYERLVNSLEPEVATAILSLDRRRRAALLRPGSKPFGMASQMKRVWVRDAP